MKYFDQYCALIDAGHIQICEETQLSIARVKRYKKTYTFKQQEADTRISFIETHCSNTKGLSGQLKLALPQKVWLEVAWGFYHQEKVEKIDPETMQSFFVMEERRLIKEVPLIVPRGTGKTTLGSAIGMVGLLRDGEYGADVQMLAYDRKQAGYLFNASRAMVSRKGSILNVLKKKEMLRSTKQGLLFEPTNSLMQISTSNYDSLDGTNCHYNIFDEVHTYDDDFIKVVNDGSSRKRNNWMSWYISTQGTKRDKLFDAYYDIWEDILHEKIKDDRVMPWIYKLDDVEEIHDPTKWPKAMPLLGITTRIEEIAHDIDRCKNDPIGQAELMAKTFNLPVDNYHAYFTNEECRGWPEKFHPSLFQGDEMRSAYCVLGLDLSDVNDICSISFMVVDGDKRYFLNRKYLPRSRVDKLPRERKNKYRAWEQQGHLVLHELDHNDQEFIFNDILAFMQEQHIYPIMVGYDKWNAKVILNRFKDYYGDVLFEVKQNVKTLSMPLKIYKAKIGHEKIIFDDPVATFCHMNTKVKVDGNGNVFPNKEKSKEKIDVMASQLDAFIAYEENVDELAYYFEREGGDA